MSALNNGRLVFDSDAASAKVGRRSASVFGRTLLFRSAEFAVDVVVHPGAEDLRLFHGQIVDERTGAPLSKAAVSFDGAEETVSTDDFGQFALSALEAPAERVLRVRTPDRELVCAIPPTGSDG